MKQVSVSFDTPRQSDVAFGTHSECLRQRISNQVERDPIVWCDRAFPPAQVRTWCRRAVGAAESGLASANINQVERDPIVWCDRAFPPAQVRTWCRRAVGAAESMETCSLMLTAATACAREI